MRVYESHILCRNLTDSSGRARKTRRRRCPIAARSVSRSHEFSKTGRDRFMREAGAYGQRLGSCFQREDAHAVVASVLGKAEIAVTELRCDSPGKFMSGSIPYEDAYLVALHMRDY